MSDHAADAVSPEQALAHALLQQRQAAREQRDYAAADALRAQIDELGFLVVDTAEGPALQLKPAYTVLDASATFPSFAQGAKVSVTVIVDGWLDDALDFATRFATSEPNSMHLLLVDVSGDDTIARALEPLGREDQRITVLHIDPSIGWSAVHAAAAASSEAPFYAVADMSTLIEGAVLDSCVRLLEDGVMAVGWRGANIDQSDQWRSVVDSGAGECDVLLSYLMAMRTRDAQTTPPHPRARFYRNADIEWSLLLRQAHLERTGSAARMIALGSDAPLQQGRHHGYHDSDPQVRDRESRKTYDRILSAFRGRTDLLAGR